MTTTEQAQQMLDDLGRNLNFSESEMILDLIKRGLSVEDSITASLVWHDKHPVVQS